MQIAISEKKLLHLVLSQIKSFFLIDAIDKKVITKFISNSLVRAEICFAASLNKYYKRDGCIFFNPYHSGQYSVFLYFLSNTIWKNESGGLTADKIYYLNKALNGVDLFYEVEMPSIFFLDHPVGSVMGRAKYGEGFSFSQNCTVGNNNGIYPQIGKNVTMHSGSMILGKCIIGDNVSIAARACVKDQDVPSNSIVFGASPDLIIKPKRSPEI